MKLTQDLRVDVQHEEEGEWITWPEHPAIKVHVKSSNAQSYEDYISKLTRRMMQGRSNLRAGLSPAETREADAKATAECLLLDWAGVPGENGEDIPFSKKTAFEVLCEPENRPFRQFVAWAAAQVGTEVSELEEEAAQD